MEIDTEDKICFCFDRDETVSIGHPPGPIPLRIVEELSGSSKHGVWATGNQALKGEADIPGRDEAIEQLPNHIAAAVRYPGRREILEIVYEVTDYDEYIVVDDVDLSDMEDFDHYFPDDFMREFDIDD